MDSLAFRFANALVGNPEDAAGLEITLTGVSQTMSDASTCLTLLSRMLQINQACSWLIARRPANRLHQTSHRTWRIF